jgi:chemotaxis protein CheD
MNKFFDITLNREIITIYPGELYITKKSELITTILGSCISIVLFDEQNSIGGINHYMLPAAPPESKKNSVLPITRFGEYAIKTLIQEMINQGASLKNLKAKIFGGSNVLNFSLKKDERKKDAQKKDALIGEENINFARKFLKKIGIPIVSEDVGGVSSRKIFFDTTNYKVFLKRINSAEN